jgi:acetyltransferase-like isoleucine patch superfamily enzyme
MNRSLLNWSINSSRGAHRLGALAIRAYNRVKADLFYRFLFRRFGKRSSIRRPLLIVHPEHIEIGDRVVIRDGARLEVFKDGVTPDPLLIIGSDTNIEQNVHIACHCRIVIGSRVSITANCAIVDTTHPFDLQGDPRKIGDRICTVPSFVEIGDGCFIGIGAVILPNVRIGEGAVIGSNAVVTHDIPAYSVAVGQPARVIRTYKP